MIRFRKSYKYQLASDYKFHFYAPADCLNFNEADQAFYSVYCDESTCVDILPKVNITIKRGYCWDGCTWIKDTEHNMEAGLMHDLLYQAIRERIFAHELYKIADSDFQRNCIKRGTHFLAAAFYYKVLCLLKGKYARPKNIKKVLLIA